MGCPPDTMVEIKKIRPSATAMEISDFHRLFKQGKTLKELSKRFGRPERTLRDWIKKDPEAVAERERQAAERARQRALSTKLQCKSTHSPLQMERLRREAARQGTTLSEIIQLSVALYLDAIDAFVVGDEQTINLKGYRIEKQEDSNGTKALSA